MSTTDRSPAVTRDGRDRFHTALSPARRAALESQLLAVDHPDLWSDAALERREQAQQCGHGWSGPWNGRPCGCGRPEVAR